MIDLRPIGYIVGLVVAVMGAIMLVPLGLLSLGAMFAGFYFHDWFVGDAESAF